MIFRVFDIETVPDLTVWTPGPPNYKLVPRVGGGVEAVETEQFPPAHSHRVVAISCVDVRFDPTLHPKYQYASCYTSCKWSRDAAGLEADEHLLLSVFGEAARATPDVHFVSWNGRTFDLPVIALRSLKHKLACGWYYDTNDPRIKSVRYRYSPEGHCDLMDYWSDFGACRPMKLHDAARLIGLPGKTDMSGASIEGIYKSTLADPTLDLVTIQASVARYCLQDSIQTALMWVRARHHLGKITPEMHNLIIDTFAASADINNAITLDWDRLKL
jgi:hypothetical protein